jgi:hypothetical protein
MPKIDLDERIKIHDLVLEDIDLGAGTARLSADREPKGRKEAVVATKRQTASSSFICPTSALQFGKAFPTSGAKIVLQQIPPNSDHKAGMERGL